MAPLSESVVTKQVLGVIASVASPPSNTRNERGKVMWKEEVYEMESATEGNVVHL